MKTIQSRGSGQAPRWSSPRSGWLESVVYFLLGLVVLAAAWQCQVALVDFAPRAAAVGERLMEPPRALAGRTPLQAPAAIPAAWAVVEASTNVPSTAFGNRTSGTPSAI